MSSVALGPRHAEVKRLRALLRDRYERAAERAFVVEGPRAIDGVLDRGGALDAAYLAPGASRAFASLVTRLEAAGVRLAELKEGVLERVGSTVTPQPVIAVAPMRVLSLGALPADGLVLVAVGLADPGNAGTLLRSAEAAGVVGVVFCANSVDPFNPKAVRSSAGAIAGVPLVAGPDGEGDDPVEVLDALGAGGRRRLGAVATGGAPYDRVDLVRPTAVVLGSEAHGLDAQLAAVLDGAVSIPMAGPAESLNVAMAATVLSFEWARQRRAAEAR